MSRSWNRLWWRYSGKILYNRDSVQNIVQTGLNTAKFGWRKVSQHSPQKLISEQVWILGIAGGLIRGRNSEWIIWQCCHSLFSDTSSLKPSKHLVTWPLGWMKKQCYSTKPNYSPVFWGQQDLYYLKNGSLRESISLQNCLGSSH